MGLSTQADSFAAAARCLNMSSPRDCAKSPGCRAGMLQELK